MPRSQDAQVTGGQLDPYVQQSLLQGKQQASNRLITAMQEAGAGQRQAAASSAEMERQKLAGQQAMQQQAIGYREGYAGEEPSGSEGLGSREDEGVSRRHEDASG
jgi:hypothetical protein